MADEPNTRMDETLKAYAAKRRQEAAGPFEMHPATRQMLRGEVARTYKQVPPVSWLRRVVTLWPRMAFAAACVAVTVTLLLIVLPSRTVTEMAQTKTEAEVLTRDSRLADREKDEAANLDAFANGPAPAASTAPVMPAPKPVDKLESKADDLKAKSELMVEARKDTDAVRQLREEVSLGKQLAGGRFYRANTEPARARYMQRSPDTRLGVKLQDAQQTTQALLNSFELRQAGNEVQVIDGDGSVYVGNFLTGDEAKKTSFSIQNAPSAPAAVAGAAAAPEQQLMFYAVGTNLSLRQKVSIEANILQLQTNALPGLAPPEPAKNQRAPAQNTIQVRARVGTNQEGFYFEAVPAKP